MNTLNAKPNFNIFALFKGMSGSGKSVGALSFPKPYVFDFDHKMPNIAIKHFRNKEIEYDTFESSGDVYDKLYPWLSGEKECPYETLIFDSITALSRLIMNTTAEIKGETIKTLLERKIDKKRGGSMIEPLGYDYYNSEVRFIDWILSASKVLWSRSNKFPNNIIFTAHVLEVKSKPNIETKVTTVTRSIMALGNKAPAMIPGEFDELYVFGTQEVGGLSNESETKHVMFTQTTGEDDAKTAFNLSRMTDFTNKNLYDLLKAQIAGGEMFA